MCVAELVNAVFLWKGGGSPSCNWKFSWKAFNILQFFFKTENFQYFRHFRFFFFCCFPLPPFYPLFRFPTECHWMGCAWLCFTSPLSLFHFSFCCCVTFQKPPPPWTNLKWQKEEGKSVTQPCCNFEHSKFKNLNICNFSHTQKQSQKMLNPHPQTFVLFWTNAKWGCGGTSIFWKFSQNCFIIF